MVFPACFPILSPSFPLLAPSVNVNVNDMIDGAARWPSSTGTGLVGSCKQGSIGQVHAGSGRTRLSKRRETVKGGTGDGRKDGGDF